MPGAAPRHLLSATATRGEQHVVDVDRGTPRARGQSSGRANSGGKVTVSGLGVRRRGRAAGSSARDAEERVVRWSPSRQNRSSSVEGARLASARPSSSAHRRSDVPTGASAGSSPVDHGVPGAGEVLEDDAPGHAVDHQRGGRSAAAGRDPSVAVKAQPDHRAGCRVETSDRRSRLGVESAALPSCFERPVSAWVVDGPRRDRFGGRTASSVRRGRSVARRASCRASTAARAAVAASARRGRPGSASSTDWWNAVDARPPRLGGPGSDRASLRDVTDRRRRA